MATNSKKVTPQEANDALNALALGQDSKISLDEAFKVMKDADTSQMESLSRKYFVFPGFGTYLFMVEGVSTVQIKEKPVQVVELLNSEKEQLINGDRVLVDSVLKLTTLPCFIKVVYDKDIKNATGTYKNLKVYTFSSNVAK